MSQSLWKILVLSSVFLCGTFLAEARTLANELAVEPTTNNSTKSDLQISPTDRSDRQTTLNGINLYSNDIEQNNPENSLGQITSVSQFSDVQPSDWAFQALQSLVEHYNCISGYNDSTFRGNHTLNRFEFAAALNACLNRINEIIASGTANVATKQDLETVQRLQGDFKTELATLGSRVDALGTRTSQLEAHQFSTTTKLVGEAIFALTTNFNNKTFSDVNGPLSKNNQAAFQDRVRLDLQTSFTGQDTLHTRIAAGNGTNPLIGSYETTQTFNLFNGANNQAYIDWLAYYFPVGKSQIYVAAAGGIQSDYVPTNSPYFQDYDGGNGALSTFASESPIYRIGGGSGAGINFNLASNNKSIIKPSLTLGYLASTANNPAPSTGLVDGNYAGLAQLNLNVGDRIALGATYVHGYNSTGTYLFDGGSAFLGKANASPVVGTTAANIGGYLPGAYESNSYGFEGAVKASSKLSINGFFLYSNIGGLTGSVGKNEVWSYGIGLALPDFGKKGNVLGLFGGAQPYLGSGTNIGSIRPYQIEAFYKYKINDNISVTPGLIWLITPEQIDNNPDAVVGTLRTTFVF